MKSVAFIMLMFILIGNQLNTNGQDAKFQALIIYNFTKLIDWPDKSGSFVITIVGNTELAKELKDFTANRKVGGIQEIAVEKLLVNEINNAQILYVGLTESANLTTIIEKMGSNNTLLITEKSGLTDKGAGISFIKKSGAWKFQFKESNIKNQGLKVSSDFKGLGIAM